MVASCGRLGFRERPGTDGAIDVPADSGASARCGGIDLLADTFTATTPSLQWYVYQNGGITTVQTGGQAVITLPATTAASSNYGGFDSVLRYDARGQRITVEVPQTVSAATTAQTDIQLVSPADDTVSIVEESGKLFATQYIGGTGAMLDMIPYDPVAHRWWAFHEDAGTLAFETSPDGVTFTSFSSMPAPAFVGRVAFVLESGSFESVTNPGTSRFDNVNGGTAAGSFCAASTLGDDFNSGTIGDEWAGAYTSGGCTYQETGGQVTVSLTTGAGEECALRSANAYDLTSDAAFTEITAVPGIAQTYAVLRASVAGGDAVEVAIAGTQLQCGQIIANNYTTSCSIPYDPVAHRFVRLRGAGGMIAWETSPDATTWTTRGQIASPIALDRVLLSVGAGTNGAPAMASSATFGTFNVLPP